VEEDGRVFPVSDQSETVVECLMTMAEAAGVQLNQQSGLKHIASNATGS